MSSRTTPKSTRALLTKALGQEADFSKDIGILFAFAAAATSPTPPTLIAALGLVLQAAGSTVTAAMTLTSRLWKKIEDDSLQPFECFNALFLITTIRAYMDALSQILSEEISKMEGSEDALSRKVGHKDDALKKQAMEEAQVRAKDLNDADLTYLFGVEPLAGDVPLLKALHDWLTSSLAALGMRPFEVARIADSCDKSARVRFHAILAQDNDESRWMREFLALESRGGQEGSLHDLSETLSTLHGWLVQHDTSTSVRDAWDEYRTRLRSLPDLKDTMFNEDFGVSQVFQAPRVEYHVAGALERRAYPTRLRMLGGSSGRLLVHVPRGKI